MDKTQGDVLDIRGVCGLLGIGLNTAYDLTRKGYLPGRRLGRQWRFSKRKILEWLEEPIDWELTREIENSPQLQKELQQASEEIKEGKGAPWKELKHEL